MLAVSEPHLQRNMHATQIVNAYQRALEDIVDILENQVAMDVDISNDVQMLEIIGRYGNSAPNL
jgi:chaperonin GroEL (HSP60 family)